MNKSGSSSNTNVLEKKLIYNELNIGHAPDKLGRYEILGSDSDFRHFRFEAGLFEARYIAFNKIRFVDDPDVGIIQKLYPMDLIGA